MTDEQKLLWMFKEVHGEITGACYVEFAHNDEDYVEAINVMKHGNLCWTATKADLVFDYLTKHLDEKTNETND